MALPEFPHQILLSPPARSRRGTGVAAALPLDDADRTADLLIAVEELRAEFDVEEANAIRWIEPHVDALWREVDALVRKLAQ